MAEATSEPKRLRVADPVWARIALLGNSHEMPLGAPAAMARVRAAILTAAREIASAVENAPAHDKGRLIAAMDALMLAKNIANDSIILPHAEARWSPSSTTTPATISTATSH
jgi:hypothetical protein